MKNSTAITMRDVFIGQVYARMKESADIFFLSDDFGAPMLDALRKDFPGRFINVGIAEQNLINISTGLALEGFSVYAYGIAPFLAMRAYEQIRNNLAIFSQLRKFNVNLVGVGAGLSYEVSGPTHHCLEDIGIMRMLPNISVFSPSDWVVVKQYVAATFGNKSPKYLRLDAKPLPQLYEENQEIPIGDGFFEMCKGDTGCLVATGYMTHRALQVRDALLKDGIVVGVVDVFLLRPFNADAFWKTINKYKFVVTLEEAFINRGGLDGLVSGILDERNAEITLKRMGFDDAYVFDIGNREYLHAQHNLDTEGIARNLKKMLE